mgnify:CR=1 FL=1
MPYCGDPYCSCTGGKNGMTAAQIHNKEIEYKIRQYRNEFNKTVSWMKETVVNYESHRCKKPFDADDNIMYYGEENCNNPILCNLIRKFQQEEW